jgi:Flp pilus assembly protein CpaB
VVHRRRLRQLTRHPVPFWLAAIALTALTVSTVAHVAGAAADERARWGTQRAVLVARHDLSPGDPLRDVDVRMVPAALVPRGAARDASDRTVVQWIGAGEIVLARRLAPGGLSPTAARLPRGTRGVAVPQGQAPLPVEIGDHVDVVATLETSVTVATDAPRVADAVASATVTLVLSGAT